MQKYEHEYIMSLSINEVRLDTLDEVELNREFFQLQRVVYGKKQKKK